MKEIKKEIINYVTKYQSFDGIEFNSKEECEKYENSAKGIVRSRFSKLVVRDIDEYSLFFGNEENTVYYVQFREEGDIDTFLHYMYLINPWLLNDDHKSQRESIIELSRKAFNNDEPLLVSENYEGNMWVLDTLSSLISRLNDYDRD